MSPTRTLMMLLFAAAAARGAENPPKSVVVRVPVVGSVWGIGAVRWKTDVELYNDMAHEVTVWLSLPTMDAPLFSVDIPPGSVQKYPDIVAEAFGLDSALSPLEVMTDGNRSVRIAATVYGVRGTDVFTPEPIPIDYGSGNFYPQRTLNGLSFSDTFRTNVGLANLSDREATFLLALQRLAGRNLAITRITLQPSSLTHVSIQSLFPMITKGDDFTVLVETGSRDTYVYASVIDNSTNEARFIQPAIGAPTMSAQEMATRQR